MARALVVQHVEVDAPALVASALEAAGVELVVHRTDQQGAPPAIDGFDALVVMGGPQSAHSDEGFPTRRAELALIADAVGRELPVLGVCLGAADARRGHRRAAPFAARPGLEVGWADVTPDPGGGRRRALRRGAGRVRPLHWHGDTVVLPPGAVLLASSDRYPNQAFRVGRPGVGHPVPPRGRPGPGRGVRRRVARRGPPPRRAAPPASSPRPTTASPPWRRSRRSILGRFASTASGDRGR